MIQNISEKKPMLKCIPGKVFTYDHNICYCNDEGTEITCKRKMYTTLTPELHRIQLQSMLDNNVHYCCCLREKNHDNKNKLFFLRFDSRVWTWTTFQTTVPRMCVRWDRKACFLYLRQMHHSRISKTSVI